MGSQAIDLSAGLVPKSGNGPQGGIDLSAGLVPKASLAGQSTEDTAQGPYTVITPKGWGTSGEESFSDTVQRAISYQKSLTPDERQRQISAEISTMPKKVPETLAGAAGIGLAGPAALAGAGEVPAVLGAGIKALLPAATRCVVGVTAWAAEHPVAAKMIWEGLKAGLTGTAAGAGARFAGKIINAAPTGE
jgi:hypothetical protein